MKKIFLPVLIILLTVTIIPGQAQSPEKKSYKATRIHEAPVINGILDEEIWKRGEWIDDFIQYEPYNGKAASQRTEFKILFDNDNLYAGIRAYDTSPDSIVRRLTRRDQTDGDILALIIDSFHDLRTGFAFGISASGVKYDLIYTNDGQNEDYSWNPNWWAKTTVTNEGWTAEMKIPFSQLRFDKNTGDVWGFQVLRVLYRKNEASLWQHIPKDSPGLIHMFGELSGLDEIKPRKIFDITPYGVVKAEKFKAEPGNPFLEKGSRYGLTGGIDTKIGITSNMTMDLTINPDFGQVEADPSVVNLSAYETFYKERRPFFVEGNNITNYNIGLGDGDVGNDNLFYSRRIGRQPQGSPELREGWHADIPINTKILGAVKLTGKTGKGLSLGFIEAVTAGEKAATDTVGGRINQTVEPLTNYFIGRVQKDFREGKTILGGIFTSTNRDTDPQMAGLIHRSAYSGGFDFTQYTRNKNWMLSINTAFSQVNGTREAIQLTQESSVRYFQRPDNDHNKYDPERTSLTGTGGRIQVQKLNGHLFLLGCTMWKSPGFEINDLGYVQTSDQIMSVLAAGYSEWEPRGIYRNYNFNADIWIVHSFAGQHLGTGIEWNGSMGFKNYWSAWTGGNLSFSQLSPGTLRGGPMMKIPGTINLRGGLSSDHRKKLNLSLFGNFSRGLEKDSRNLYSELGITYKPVNYITLTFSPGFNSSSTELQYVTKLTKETGDSYIFASIDRKTISASFRVNLNLSPDLTLQYWGQPFVASGKYYDHKVVTDPTAGNFRDRFLTFTREQTRFDAENNKYIIDLDLNGEPDFEFNNSNFNFREFLSNLVIRWEYNPGSSLYLVWSQTRSYSD
ncbi:MAG: carbohydrate binding family 9 domain-containing protein, partial [Bacteroidales bacterium]|nr:carbohydrate binding family 9 domain-containing protein [Bacteroidales bacterium]